MESKVQKAPPIWGVVLAAVLVHLGSHASMLAQHDLSISDLYFPSTISIILVHWIGPRYVLPIMFINSVATSPLWGNSIDQWELWFLYAIPEVLYPLLSWLLFRKLYAGHFWLPDIRNTILFLIMGVTVPALIEIFTLQGFLLLTGKIPSANFLEYVASNLLSEFASTFCITLPVLYYVSPLIYRAGYLPGASSPIPPVRFLSRHEARQMVLIFSALVLLSFFISFSKYWYVFGFFAVYSAIRFGFGPAVITNFLILLVSYVLPRYFINFGEHDFSDVNEVSSIFLGANFLFVFAAITGRVISDVRHAEARLLQQNAELAQINAELDRFVYSVSHDLSAPLKSILGLVNISRIGCTPAEHGDYLDRIEVSVFKLERFIAQILDYSKNKRTPSVMETVDLKSMCDDILEHLHYATEPQPLEIQYDLAVSSIHQDSQRTRIVLNNLLSNAVRFQKQSDSAGGLVKISSRRVGRSVVINIEDNGEGVREEQQSRIFDMFYRGSERSAGSGLGLYIARQVARTMQGSISFTSVHRKGSVFSFTVPDLIAFD